MEPKGFAAVVFNWNLHRIDFKSIFKEFLHIVLPLQCFILTTWLVSYKN